MKELILFNIRRKLHTKTQWIINILLFVIIFALFHADWFVSPYEKAEISIDQSLQMCHEALEAVENADYCYVISNDEMENSVGYDQGIKLKGPLFADKEMAQRVILDIQRVLVERNEYDLGLIEVSIENEAAVKQDHSWIAMTLIYAMVVTLGSSLCNEIIWEKSSHVLEMLLTNISAKEHLLSKIITNLIVPLIQMLTAILFTAVNALIRYFEDGFDNLRPFFRMLIQTQPQTQTALGPAVIPVFAVVLCNMVLIQVLMTFLVSRLSNADEIANYQNIFYAVLLGLYYLIMMGSGLLAENWAGLLSLMPVVSMFTLSGRFLLGQVSFIETLLSLLANGAALVLLIQWMEPAYKENLMSISH